MIESKKSGWRANLKTEPKRMFMVSMEKSRKSGERLFLPGAARLIWEGIALRGVGLGERRGRAGREVPKRKFENRVGESVDLTRESATVFVGGLRRPGRRRGTAARSNVPWTVFLIEKKKRSWRKRGNDGKIPTETQQSKSIRGGNSGRAPVNPRVECRTDCKGSDLAGKIRALGN